MASSGKKGKKSKGKTLSLNTFLQEHPGTTPIIPARNTALNWADEVEESYGFDGRQNKPVNVVLPTAPKAARGVDEFSDKIPHNPPYMAFISNLPYDCDEDEIADFFRNLKIANMRIPKGDKAGEGNKVRGFGYVEFEDRDSLIQALVGPACIIKGRRVKIEVSTNETNERRRGGNRMDSNRNDRSERSDVIAGDWRSMRKEQPEFERRGGDRGGGGGGGFNRDRDRGEGPGAWRDASDRPSFRDDKPITRGERFGERDSERRGFGPRRDERNGGVSRRSDDDQQPRTRPKLNLAPRTKPIENIGGGSGSSGAANSEQPPPPTTTTTPEVKDGGADATNAAAKVSIFGDAKPVDTTARERQIEERLARLNLENENRKDDEQQQQRRKDERTPRRYSPPRRSPDRRGSPDRGGRGSNDRRSLERRRSPDARRSPTRKRYSPERRRNSPDRKRMSPERRRTSPDAKKTQRRNVIDDKKGPRNEKPRNEKEKRPPKEYTERDMPKLNTPEPIDIVDRNQYSFLEVSDSD